MDDKWLAIDLIHDGEEEVALAVMSGDIPDENGFDLIRWAGSEVLDSTQAIYGASFLLIFKLSHAVGLRHIMGIVSGNARYL